MRSFILVTGQMRSGTSMVAQVLHMLGVPMAETITAPAWPSFESDWEDVPLIAELYRRFPMNTRKRDRRTLGRWFAQYAVNRMKLARGWDDITGGTTLAVGCKSPLLALGHRQVERALSLLGAMTTWIIVRRDQGDVDASVRRTFEEQGLPGLEFNKEIGRHLAEIRKPVVVSYEAFVTQPELSVCRMGTLLGVNDALALRRAVDKINRKEVA